MSGRVLLAAALALAVGACGARAADQGAGATATPMISTIDAAALEALTTRHKALLVDVRTPEEFAQGHISGAVNMPLEAFDPAEVPHEAGTQTVLYCHSGRRSKAAAEKMVAAGEPATHLGGGISAWEAAGEPVVRAN